MLQHHWETASNGNFVARETDDQILCTIFQNDYQAWGVVINIADRFGHPAPHFSEKYFANPHDAKVHAEHLLSNRSELQPTDRILGTSSNTFSNWREQKTKSNGQPTFGRKAGRIRLSAKCAQSGKWFFVAYRGSNSSVPEGWYPTAEEAMQAADQKYGRCV